MAEWLKTSLGQDLLAWEQGQLDERVADIFGFHALQLGLPEVNGLEANRMPHRWVAVDRAPGSMERSTALEVPPGMAALSLSCDFDALPFDSQSLDLVVLPHSLELARDPHLALREVERVLVPEGKVVILGFNPASLWGVRQRIGHWGGHRGLFLPREGEFIAYRRLRDWLRLLSFEVEAGRFGCYRPALTSERWLSRLRWMESVGERWWPVFGAVYLIVAVKRVRGMRLVGMARQQRRLRQNAAPAPVTQAQHHEARKPPSTRQS